MIKLFTYLGLKYKSTCLFSNLPYSNIAMVNYFPATVAITVALTWPFITILDKWSNYDSFNYSVAPYLRLQPQNIRF